MDNLPSVTYQVFEQDPVKYAQYEEVRTIHSWSIGLAIYLGIGYVSGILRSPS